jgi:hypothetical protein
MDLAERDAQLLSVFEPEDRRALEDSVDEILRQELPVFDVLGAIALSTRFERAARGRADDQKLVALALAALLRMRARQALALRLVGPDRSGQQVH